MTGASRGLFACGIIFVLVLGESGPAAGVVTGVMVVANNGGRFGDALKKYYYEPFSRATGIQVVMDPLPEAQMIAKLQAQQASGHVTWSLLSIFDQDAYANVGMLQSLPADIKAKALQLYGPKLVSDFGIKRGLSASVFVCNPSLVKACPRNASELFNVEQYHGRRALFADGWLENVAYALEADGVPRGKLFPLDLDRAYKKLDTIKLYINVWWRTGDQSQQIFRDKEVAMGVMWDGRAYGLKSQGTSLSISHDGAVIGTGFYVVPKNAPNGPAGFEFMRWFMDHPEAQSKIEEITGYAEPSPKATAFLPETLKAQMASDPRLLAQEVSPDMAWIAQHRTEMLQRWIAWLQK